MEIKKSRSRPGCVCCEPNRAVESPTCKIYVKIRLKPVLSNLGQKLGQRTPASGRCSLGRPSKPTALEANKSPTLEAMDVIEHGILRLRRVGDTT